MGERMAKKYTDMRDSCGRRKTTYHNISHYEKDWDEAVRDIEERMIRYCDEHKLNFSFVSKLKIADKMGCGREYRNALYGKRNFS